MTELEIKFPINLNSEEIILRFEQAVNETSLSIKSRGTLKTIPGSVHWHIVDATKKGTLEATYCPNKKRLTLSFRDNHYGDWIDDAIVKIKKLLESE